MSDGEKATPELVEEIRNLRSEMEALRKEVRSGDSRPDPENAREAQAQAEERGDMNAAAEAKARRAMDAAAENPPNGNTPSPEGWL